MLRGNIDEGWLTHFGLKCSSNTAVNAGTSSRSVCSSIGNTDFQSVRDSNCLGSRTSECITSKHVRFDFKNSNVDSIYYSCIYKPSEFLTGFIHSPRTILLMMVAICLNACIMLEQPFSSFFEYYPRWRDFMRMLQYHGGLGAVACLNTQFVQVSAKMQTPTIAARVFVQDVDLTAVVSEVAFPIRNLGESCGGCTWLVISHLHCGTNGTFGVLINPKNVKYFFIQKAAEGFVQGTITTCLGSVLVVFSLTSAG